MNIFLLLSALLLVVAAGIGLIRNRVDADSGSDEFLHSSTAARRRTQTQAQALVEYPEFRYVPWDEVEPKEAAKVLRYREETWNLPGTARVESRKFSRLNVNQTAAAERLGFTELSWDCYQLHFFSGYTWRELEESGYQIYWEIMGWNRTMWEGDADAPESFYTSWNSLNETHREAARAVCYFRETWDQVDISLWEEIRAIENEPDLTQDNIPNLEVEYQYPELRYVPWSEVEPLEAALTLGYTEETWNSPGRADIEGFTFSQLNANQTAAAERLGFTELSWDCYQNHFFWGYPSWLALKETGFHVHWQALGWNVLNWEGYEASPETEEIDWDLLDESQREAARRLCFFEETWDQVNITLWREFQPTPTLDVPNRDVPNPIAATTLEEAPTDSEPQS